MCSVTSVIIVIMSLLLMLCCILIGKLCMPIKTDIFLLLAISIQFGEEQYSTSEELEAVNVTLTKNTVSEQTFSLNITSSDSSLDDIDLETIGPVVFPPDQQTLSVTIPLVNDDETEGTETHLLRIVQDPNGPQFNASNRQQATIVIRDDEVVGELAKIHTYSNLML